MRHFQELKARRRGRAAPHTPAPPPKHSPATAQWPCRTLPLRTTSESAVRSRADSCFAVAEQASEATGPAHSVLVRSGRLVGLGGDDRIHGKQQRAGRSAASLRTAQLHGGCRTKPSYLVEPRFAAGDLPRTLLRGLENALHDVAFRRRGRRPALCNSLHGKQQRARPGECRVQRITARADRGGRACRLHL